MRIRTSSRESTSKRREHGWSIHAPADHLGVDEGTWRDWEAGKTILYRKHRTAVAKLLGLDQGVLFDAMAPGGTARTGRGSAAALKTTKEVAAWNNIRYLAIFDLPD